MGFKTLIVCAHPAPDSFNRALVDECERALLARGHQVRRRDLYAEPFAPVLTAEELAGLRVGQVAEDVRREQAHLDWADHLVFVYPIWWFDRPAVLKGWIDRVLSFGYAYVVEGGVPRGKLRHRRALVLQTAGTPDDQLRASGALEIMQRTMTDGTLTFCGIPDVRVRTFGAATRATAEERMAWIAEIGGPLLAGW